MTKARILIVEDEGVVAKDIRSTLKRLGYTVPAVVSSGEAAIERAADLRPDLVLMDIVLKGTMDGIEAAAQIRDRLDIPVVFLTAYGDDETLQRAQVTAPFGYILKPFGERELLISIEVALYRYRTESELARLVGQLQDALAQIKTLRGLLPICANCKKIRDDEGYWHNVEVYVAAHSEVVFSHGICPDCVAKLYPGLDLEEE